MLNYVLLDSVTVDTEDSSNPALVARNDAAEYGIFQVDITGGSADIELYGRLSPNMSWKLVKQYSSSEAERVTLFPQMYARALNVNGATVRAMLHG